MAAEMNMTFKEAHLIVQFETVSIQLKCASAYEAQVLFDDLAERLQAGDKITFQQGPKA